MTKFLINALVASAAVATIVDARKMRGKKKNKNKPKPMPEPSSDPADSPCQLPNDAAWTVDDIIQWRHPPENTKEGSAACLACVVGILTSDAVAAEDKFNNLNTAYTGFTACGANWGDSPPEEAPAGLELPQPWDVGLQGTPCAAFPDGEGDDNGINDWPTFATAPENEDCLNCVLSVLKAGTKKAGIPGIFTKAGAPDLETTGCEFTALSRGPDDEPDCTYVDAVGAFGTCGSPAGEWTPFLPDGPPGFVPP